MATGALSDIAAMNETLRAVAALPEHGAQCLPGRFYTDPDYFRYEVETFLAREWHCLGRADEIRSRVTTSPPGCSTSRCWWCAATMASCAC